MSEERKSPELSDSDLDTALSTLGKQAANYASIGPKSKEDATHVAINSLLDMREERARLQSKPDDC